MKHYRIVFILTASFANLYSGMEHSFGKGLLDQKPVNPLNWILFLHNKLKLTRDISILKEDAQGPNVLCDIDLKFINGTKKSSLQLKEELIFYLDHFHAEPPKDTIRAPNKMWINCDSESNAARFSFNAEGKLMFDGKILVEKNKNKKLRFGSFAGKSITLEKQKYPENYYRAIFLDWNNARYVLYIDTQCREITYNPRS